MNFKILIVDDVPIIRQSIEKVLAFDYYSLKSVESGEEALEVVDEWRPDLILLDIKLNGLDGLQVLDELKKRYQDILVIMITGYASVKTAIQAMKAGAYDYIQKPLNIDELRNAVANCLETIRLKKEVEELRSRQMGKNKIDKIIGNSEELQHVFSLVKQFAISNATILIEGESGTGKELVADYTHYLSARYAKPFIALNCGAVAKDLIESELFGYEGGAFTGASEKGKVGLLEQADAGTLFLDEVGEMPLEVQVKFLRVLESGDYYRIGNPNLKRVDLRVIAATNAPLKELISQGKFREDLYYRLNIAKIELPPLRERKADIMPLTKFFINNFNNEFGKKVTGVTKDVEEFLLSYIWNGNVRELRNIMERMMILTQNDIITIEDLANAGLSSEDNFFNIFIKLNTSSNGNVLHRTTRDIILKTLDLTNGNKSQAAKRLGVPRSTLRHYLQRN